MTKTLSSERTKKKRSKQDLLLFQPLPYHNLLFINYFSKQLTMSKIRNWTRIQPGDRRYEEKFRESRFDRQANALVWKLDNYALYYVTYKNIDGYYISEYVGMDSEFVENPIAGVEDFEAVKSKDRAHTISTDILEDHPFPTGDYDKGAIKLMTKKQFKDLYHLRHGKTPSVSLGYLQQSSKKYARIRGSGVIKLWVDWNSYMSASAEDNLQVLIHELAHVEESNHKTEFWEEVFTIYDMLSKNREAAAQNAPVDSYDWEEVKKLIVKDIHSGNLDLRTSTVGEMRARAEEELGIKVDDRYARDKWKSKFENVSVRPQMSSPMPSIDTNKAEVVMEHEFSTEQLWKKFKEVRKRDRMTSSSGSRSHWTIPTPSVREEENSKVYHPCSREDEIMIQIMKEAGSSGRTLFTPKYEAC